MSRPTRIRVLQATAAAFALGTLIAPGTANAADGPAALERGAGATSAGDWECGGGVEDDMNHPGEEVLSAVCYSTEGKGHVSVAFQSYGEVIYVGDYFDNDHRTYAEVYVERSGTATWYGEGQSRRINESFSEGKDVGVRVCTSDTSGAVCSKQYLATNFS